MEHNEAMFSDKQKKQTSFSFNKSASILSLWSHHRYHHRSLQLRAWQAWVLFVIYGARLSGNVFIMASSVGRYFVLALSTAVIIDLVIETHSGKFSKSIRIFSHWYKEKLG